MTIIIPNKIRKAVRREWKISSDYENRIRFSDIYFDWVVWKIEDENKAGGLRLIVPKNGFSWLGVGNWFSIPSFSCADDKCGVSWEYKVKIEKCEKASHQAAKIISKHIDITAVEAFKALRKAPTTVGTYLINTPLELMVELDSCDVRAKLSRPSWRGGYRWSDLERYYKEVA